MWHVGFRPRIKPCPLQWKHRVLTTGPAGRSHATILISLILFLAGMCSRECVLSGLHAFSFTSMTLWYRSHRTLLFPLCTSVLRPIHTVVPTPVHHSWLLQTLCHAHTLHVASLFPIKRALPELPASHHPKQRCHGTFPAFQETLCFQCRGCGFCLWLGN